METRIWNNKNMCYIIKLHCFMKTIWLLKTEVDKKYEPPLPPFLLIVPLSETIWYDEMKFLIKRNIDI